MIQISVWFADWVITEIADADKQKRVLHLTCCLLPRAHRDTMEVLFAFLNWASSFSHVDEESGSKMDIHNLATVMTPNILYPNTKNSTVDESFLSIEAVNALITYNDTMCEVSDVLVLPLGVLTNTDIRFFSHLDSRRSAVSPERPQPLQRKLGGHHQRYPQAVW